MMSIFSFFRKEKNCDDNKNTFEKQYEDELMQLTDELILKSETEIYSCFKERIAKYNPSDSPLSREKCEEIIKDLINEAVSNRKLINAYIERSISDGKIYDHYYNKIILMNDLVNETYIKLKQMQSVQERFEYKKKIYNNITGNMYLADVVLASDSYQEPARIDVGDEVDKAGGEIDETTSKF